MMDGRKGLEPFAMPMAAWLAWLENASSMWSAMSIPATASARLQELLQINGWLTAERDVLLAAAGTLDELRHQAGSGHVSLEDAFLALVARDAATL